MMLSKLNFSFPIEKILRILDTDLVKELLLNNDSKSRSAINNPAGRFFYDPWKIKSEFRGTVFEEILASLPIPVGEARIVILKPGVCYQSHADIDDRYHINIQGHYSYLIDLDTHTMFETVADGCWYTMNTSVRHVAANFGRSNRVQLVVRHLLKENKLKNPVSIKLDCIDNNVDKGRFIFDDVISPWLNQSCKNGILANFNTDRKTVRFDLEKDHVQSLQNLLPSDFKISSI